MIEVVVIPARERPWVERLHRNSWERELIEIIGAPVDVVKPIGPQQMLWCRHPRRGRLRKRNERAMALQSPENQFEIFDTTVVTGIQRGQVVSAPRELVEKYQSDRPYAVLFLRVERLADAEPVRDQPVGLADPWRPPTNQDSYLSGLARQRLHCLRLATLLEATVDREFVSCVAADTPLTRVILEGMIKHINERRIEFLLAYNFSRLTNDQELGRELLRRIDEAGCRLVTRPPLASLFSPNPDTRPLLESTTPYAGIPTQAPGGRRRIQFP